MLYQRGKVWWTEFVLEGRRVRESTGCTNKTAALRFEARRRAELLERRAGFSRKPLPPKFEEYVPEFLAWSKQQHRTKTVELHALNCATLARFLRGRFLDDITSGMVEDFKQARIREKRRNAHDGSTVSTATVNRALTTLKLIFNHARRCGFAVENPTEGVKLLAESTGSIRVVSVEEELAYLQAASQPLRDIGKVMLETGMRPEEVFRVEPAIIDFNRSTISIPFGKTKAARRTIPMTEEVRELLKNRAIAARGRYLFPSPKNPDRPIGSVRKAHDAAVTRAGIEDHFRIYDLRHTYATRAVAAGVDLPTLAVLLGHTKIQMTMRYVHPAEQQMREAAGKFERFKLASVRMIAEAVMKSPQKSPQRPS